MGTKKWEKMPLSALMCFIYRLNEFISAAAFNNALIRRLIKI